MAGFRDKIASRYQALGSGSYLVLWEFWVTLWQREIARSDSGVLLGKFLTPIIQ